MRTKYHDFHCHCYSSSLYADIIDVTCENQNIWFRVQDNLIANNCSQERKYLGTAQCSVFIYKWVFKNTQLIGFLIRVFMWVKNTT